MKRIWATLLAMVMCFSLVLAGCSSSSSDEEEDVSADAETSEDASADSEEETSENVLTGKTIALNVPATANEFFAKIGTDLEALGEEYGFEVIVDSAEGDQSQQSDQLTNYLSMDIDYVAVIPVETTGCLDAMAALKDAGIVVINMLGSLVGYEESYDYSIVQDEHAVGQGAAELAAEWIEENYPDAEDGSVKVAIYEKNTDSDAISRSEGLYEIENLTSKATVVVSYDFDNSTDTEAEAQEDADMMFLEYPDIDIVLCYSYDMALPVDEVALLQSEVSDGFAIFSVDWTERMEDKLIASESGESYVRGTSACWVNLAKNIVALINGELELDENNEYGSGSWLVTYDNLEEYLELTAS